jgi:hypothetical protein
VEIAVSTKAEDPWSKPSGEKPVKEDDQWSKA